MHIYIYLTMHLVHLFKEIGQHTPIFIGGKKKTMHWVSIGFIILLINILHLSMICRGRVSSSTLYTTWKFCWAKLPKTGSPPVLTMTRQIMSLTHGMKVCSELDLMLAAVNWKEISGMLMNTDLEK